MRSSKNVRVMSLVVLLYALALIVYSWVAVGMAGFYAGFLVPLNIGTIGAVVGVIGYWIDNAWVFAGGVVFALWFSPGTLGFWPNGIGFVALLIWGFIFGKEKLHE